MKYLILIGLIVSHACFCYRPDLCVSMKSLGTTTCKSHCEPYGRYRQSKNVCCCIPVAWIEEHQ